MIVDDDPLTLRMLERAVKSRGHEVKAFLKAEEAWEAYRKEYYPLVLLDWLMPDVDGLTLCRRMRELPHGDISVILVVTGRDQPEHLREVLEAGADDYLTKPISFKLLDVRLSIASERVELRKLRKRAEENLRKQADWLKVTLSSIGDAVISTDNAAAVTFMNPEAERLTGWTIDQARGVDIDQVFQVVDEETKKVRESPVRRSLVEQDIVELPEDMILKQRNGKDIPVDDSAAPIKDQDGGIRGSVLVFRDVTEKVRARKALIRSLDGVQRAKREWESTADALPQLVCLLGRTGEVIRTNLAVEQWGLHRVIDVKGLDFHSIFHPDCSEPNCYFTDLWKRVTGELEEERPIDFEMEDTVLGRFFRIQFRPITARKETESSDSQSFAVAVVEDITKRRLMEKELEQAREQETEIGSRIQKSLLFGEPPRDFPDLEVSAISIPSRTIDGDFYTFFKHNDRCLDLVVGDVMGKGIPAALIGAAMKNNFLSAMSHLIAAKAGRRLPEPREVISSVHEAMADRLMKLESFLTLCYARFDLENNKVVIVDCGHPRTLHLLSRTGECRSLEGWNMPLGFAREETYKHLEDSFEPGDVFLFYSDGVIEAQKESGELYGEHRLIEFLQKNAGMHPDDLTDKVRKEVIAYAGSETFADDLTCIAVQVPMGSTLIERRTVNLVISSDLAELSKVREFFWRFWSDVPSTARDEEAGIRLELAFIESASNVMRHAYDGRTDRPIRIDAEVSHSGKVSIRLCHLGAGFDPQKVPLPSFDGSRDGGFGCFIIENCVDRVTYTRDGDGWNVICLEKDLLRCRAKQIS